MIRRVLWVAVPFLALCGVIALMVFAAGGASAPVIDTKGVIGNAQRDTLYLAVAVMLVVVLPVFFLTFFIAIRYRESNKKARYAPNWDSSRKLESIWWGVPILIVGVLSVIAWRTSHSLDPYRALDSDKKPLQVQVVALQWKWLFIYPEEKVASVGEFAMPVDRPVEFTITSDAPMNSFWIPQLGGQIYAMSGMSTKLHLEADEPGDYRGSSANLSGEGHASMTFVAKARSDTEFDSWLKTATKSTNVLDAASYEELRKPGTIDTVQHYKTDGTPLYESIVRRYSESHMTTHQNDALPEGIQ